MRMRGEILSQFRRQEEKGRGRRPTCSAPTFLSGLLLTTAWIMRDITTLREEAKVERG